MPINIDDDDIKTAGCVIGGLALFGAGVLAALAYVADIILGARLFG